MQTRLEQLRRELRNCRRIASITTEPPILKGLSRFASELEEEIRAEERAFDPSPLPPAALNGHRTLAHAAGPGEPD
jgi:hypothetical protein